MNIILLSGGSGKRLWPLSNDIRSKQFIKMFKNADGSYESMVQRVYRQITTVNPSANVTIATSRKQVSAIRNQLGDKVSICVEPERRDTFPAIALASVFLHDEQGIRDEEPIIICPVDPYVDNSYFAALEKLSDLVEGCGSNLFLMGIEPIIPSEKYGYIIPENKQNVSKVKSFKEKPVTAVAQEYIKQGALWNSGVFAFKLGYMLKRAHELIRFDDYRDLVRRYGEQKKISFDYAVVENEPDIQVMRYDGEWKDIGSWNTFAESMSNPVVGRAIMDDACENVHIINELNLPVLCMNCKNMIIAASVDGILISEKRQSAKIKPYVEKINQEAMFAEKSWGTYTVLDLQDESMTIKLELDPGQSMSYHSHEHRGEIWTIMSGSGKAIFDGQERTVKTGDILTMKAGSKHTICADNGGMQIIEVQLGKNIDVHDKQKYEL